MDVVGARARPFGVAQRASDAAAAEEEFGADSFGFSDVASAEDFDTDGRSEAADLAAAEASFGTTEKGLTDFPGADDFHGDDSSSDFGGSDGSYTEPGDFNSPDGFGVTDPF